MRPIDISGKVKGGGGGEASLFGPNLFYIFFIYKTLPQNRYFENLTCARPLLFENPDPLLGMRNNITDMAWAFPCSHQVTLGYFKIDMEIAKVGSKSKERGHYEFLESTCDIEGPLSRAPRWDAESANTM